MPEQDKRFLDAEEQAEKLVQMLAELRRQAVSYQDAGKQLAATREKIVHLLDSMEQLSRESRDATRALAEIGRGEMLDRIDKTLELSAAIRGDVGRLHEQSDDIANVHLAGLSAKAKRLTLLIWVTLFIGSVGTMLSIINLLK